MVTSAVLGADADLSITQQMCAHSGMSILSHTSSIFKVDTLVPAPPAPAVKTKVDIVARIIARRKVIAPALFMFEADGWFMFLLGDFRGPINRG